MVTSGHEVAALHARWPQLNLVAPGVRLHWLTAGGTAPADDQRRTAIPGHTLASGASHVAIATEQEVSAKSRKIGRNVLAYGGCTGLHRINLAVIIL